jgi:AsmA protein
MPRSRRIILFVVAGLVGLVVLVAAAVPFLVDANVYKSRLETTVSSAFGMEVGIGGRLSFAFFPGLHVTLEDVHFRNRGAEVASAGQAALQIDLLPLLRKEVRIQKISLREVRISIEKNRDGRFNLETLEADRAALPGLDFPNVSLSEAAFEYTDRTTSYKFEAVDCSVDMQRLRLVNSERANLLEGLSFTAKLACGRIHSDRFTASDLKLSVDAKNGVLDLQPVTARVYGAAGSGTIQANLAGAVPAYHVRYSVLQFPVEEVFKAMSMKNVAAGPMDFSTTLSMQGRTVKQMRQTMTGQISLRAKSLTLHGRDLDEQISRYESSQNFNLLDVAAVVLAGPLGLVATRGYTFASVIQGAEGSSEIPILVSDWKVDHGLAQAQDVAIATKANRVALQGGLDLVNEQFDDLRMAVIDAKGCATVKQKIRGTFEKPVVEKPGLLKSITGPVASLFKKSTDLLGFDCEVFYSGSVAAPG